MTPENTTCYPLVFSKAYSLLNVSADFKLRPEDFCVYEELGFELTGEGEHVFIQVEKKNLTTEALVSDICRQISLSKRDIGFSGLKDKHALTTQWLSFPWPIKIDLPVLSGQSWRVLQQTRHLRKLKRGVHKRNRFKITLRNVIGDVACIETRLQLIAKQGVPNYFAGQRFGYQGGNVGKAADLFNKKFKCKKFQKGLYYSAARSYLFNHILSRRVDSQSWDTGVEGDVFQLNGSHSLFGPEPITDNIIDRLKSKDIHPVGTLIGKGASGLGGLALKLEQEISHQYPELVNGLIHAQVKTAVRSLRIIPQELNYSFKGDTVQIEFALVTGAYATSVIHELACLNGEIW